MLIKTGTEKKTRAEFLLDEKELADLVFVLQEASDHLIFNMDQHRLINTIYEALRLCIDPGYGRVKLDDFDKPLLKKISESDDFSSDTEQSDGNDTQEKVEINKYNCVCEKKPCETDKLNTLPAHSHSGCDNKSQPQVDQGLGKEQFDRIKMNEIKDSLSLLAKELA